MKQCKKIEQKTVFVKSKTCESFAAEPSESSRRGAAILLAGGSGSRMRGAVKDKVLESLVGKPVILHSFEAFLKSGKVGEIVFVCRDSAQEKAIRVAIKNFFGKLGDVKIKYTRGGAERQDSVLNGLKEISDKSALVFIHDGARPLVGVENIERLADAAMRDGASVLASRVADTIKRVAKNKKDLSACKLDDLDRKRLWAMQTPQVFIAKKIESAYESVKKNSLLITDDVAAATLAGAKVTIVENIYPNPKITVPQDIAFVEFLLSLKK